MQSDNESDPKSAENSESVADFAAKPKAKAKGSPGVKCEKTLEFGKPIRSVTE